jgi:hypothetical protein
MPSGIGSQRGPCMKQWLKRGLLIMWLGLGVMALGGCGAGDDVFDSPTVLPLLRPDGVSAFMVTNSTGLSLSGRLPPPIVCDCDTPQHAIWVEAPQFSTFRALLRYLGLSVEGLRAYVVHYRLSLLVPSNDAFDALVHELTGGADRSILDLFHSQHRAFWQAVLHYHVLSSPGPLAPITGYSEMQTLLTGSEALRLQAIHSASSAEARISVFDGNGRSVLLSHSHASGGAQFEYLLDRVLLPRAACFEGAHFEGLGDPRWLFTTWSPRPLCTRHDGRAAHLSE